MGLYKLFSYNVEIHYKSSFLSKAMFFTLITTFLNIILPFIVAYRSRGFWLKSDCFYEQPSVHFTYEYLLVAETEDPSHPIVCGEASGLDHDFLVGEESCAEIQVQEYDTNGNGKNDVLDFKFLLNLQPDKTLASVILILALDFQLKTICPFHMQSLVVINKEFSMPSTGFKYYGDIQFYQTAHLPCIRNHIDTKYNSSLFKYQKNNHENVVDFIIDEYYKRDVVTQIKTLHLRSQNGHTGAVQLNIHLKVPEMQIKYLPSLLQELKWAWPQYLSLVVIFYWIFNKIKRFVFSNRLLMAWEIVPWKTTK